MTLFGLLSGHAMLETARDALFLAKLPASQLPWAYLALTGLVIVVAKANQGVLKRFNRRRLVSVTLVVAAAASIGFWALATTGSVIVYYALYVWTGLVATILIVQFWLVMSDMFNVAQAKRVYALIGVGATLGATAGSLLAGVLLMVLAPHYLLLIAALVFLVTAIGPLRLASAEEPPHQRRAAPNPKEVRAMNAHVMRREPYLQRLLWVVVVSAITVTAVDFLFKSVVADSVPKSELGPFFAAFYAAINGVSLVVQILVAPWLLRRIGVNRALFLLPVLLVPGAAAVVLVGGLLPAMLVRGFDGSLRHSINRTSFELLYMPLSSDVRARWKGFIDGVGQRAGQAAASLAILGALALGATLEHFGWAVMGLSVLWLLGLIGLKQHYVRLFREQLREGVVETRIDIPDLDLHSLEALLAALNSADDSEVIAALDMFRAHDKVHLVPALVLYHPSSAVVLRAFDLFHDFERQDIRPVVERLLTHPDPEIRAAALRGYSGADADEEIVRRHLLSDEPLVRVTALVCLIACDSFSGEEADHELAQVIAGGSPATREALARAIRFRRSNAFVAVLMRLSTMSESEVVREAARTMAEIPDERYLPPLVRLLDRRSVRKEARAAIVAIGDPAIEYIAGAIDDASVPLSVRRHLPRTLSRFKNARAIEVLLQQLSREEDGRVYFKILRGLGRLRADNPRLPIHAGTVRREIRSNLKRAVEVLNWRVDLSAATTANRRFETRGSELLIALLCEKERNAIERLFRLFKLLRPHEDFDLIH
ncbi:MAG: MFS transporter [Myxococcota bacterium]